MTLRLLLARFVTRIARTWRQLEVERLKDLLKSCGPRTIIRPPIAIEAAHEVAIGEDVSIGQYVHIWGNGGVNIGDRTMIASHVAITSATHDLNSPEMYKTLVLGAVTIGNDVWIGAHAVVFPGVTIGEHSVVGAGAVVRESVPPYCVVAGVPARIIRHKEPHSGSRRPEQDSEDVA